MLTAAGGRVGKLRRQHATGPVLTSQHVADQVDRITGQPGRISGHPGCRTVAIISVSRWRRSTGRGRHGMMCSCALKGRPSPISRRYSASAGHDELLMLGSAWTHAHISDALAASRLYLFAEVAILLLAERKLVQVRMPQQPLDHYSPRGRVGEHSRHRVASLVQPLIRISAPIREQQQISRAHQLDASQQVSEIGHAVYQNRDIVAGRPGHAIAITVIQPSCTIPPLGRSQARTRRSNPTSHRRPDRAVTAGR